MSCLPGTPCYSHGTVVYPRGCGIDPCYTHKTGTDLVFYNGANLPCVGVDTCDSVTLAFQKIDQKLCPDAMALAILGAITNNLSIRNMFCALVTDCIPTTTTTTSTIAPTTTTTTSSSSSTTTTTTSSSSTTTTTTSVAPTTTTTTSITPTTTTTTTNGSTTTTTTTVAPTTTTTTSLTPTTTTTTTTVEPTTTTTSTTASCTEYNLNNPTPSPLNYTYLSCVGVVDISGTVLAGDCVDFFAATGSVVFDSGLILGEGACF